MTFCKFQSTLPARGATSLWKSWLRSTRFQSTLPARGATEEKQEILLNNLFQSTLPARGATGRAQEEGGNAGYFNPRSPHGERRKRLDVANVPNQISIHAPRTGSDHRPVRLLVVVDDISIHAPRTGSDIVTIDKVIDIFISIHAPRTGFYMELQIKL